MSFGPYPVYATRADRKRARVIERRARLASDMLSGLAYVGAGGVTVAAARALKELGIELLAELPDPALVAGGLATTAILGLAGAAVPARRDAAPGAAASSVPFLWPEAQAGPTARRARAAVLAIRAPEGGADAREQPRPRRSAAGAGSPALTPKEAATVARALAAFSAHAPAARPPHNLAEIDAFLSRLEREGWPSAGLGPGLQGPGPEVGWPAWSVSAVSRAPVEAVAAPEAMPAAEVSAAADPEAAVTAEEPPAPDVPAIPEIPPGVEPDVATEFTPAPALTPAGEVPEAPVPEVPPEPVPAASTAPRRVPAPVPQRRTVVGLDVGSSAIKLVQVYPGADGLVVVNACRWPAPPGATGREGVYDPQRLGAAILPALREAGVTQRRVYTAVGGPGVIVRVAEFPPMTPEELRQALHWEWDQHIPLPPHAASLDFAILSTEGVPGEAGARMHVLLVASPRDMVEGMVHALRLARLVPRAVEIHALAAYRAAGFNGYLDDLTRRATVALVDLGHAATHISLFAHEMPVVTRSVEVGGRHLTLAVAERLGADPAEAEARKHAEGLEGDRLVASALRPLVDELAVEVLRSIDYFLVKHADFTVRRVLLLGGSAALRGLAAELEGYLREVLAGRQGGGSGAPPPLEVRVFDPTRRVALHPAVRAWLEPPGPEFAAALGLALREAPATWRR